MGSVYSTGQLEYCCGGCGKVQTRSCEELAWNLTESRDRELGRENRFASEWKEKCECGEEVAFSYRVREYPFNCLDGEELQVTGAELLRPCNIGIKESVQRAFMKADAE